MTESAENIHAAPAPWKLRGEGILMVYKFSREWIEKYAQLPDHLQGKFKGGLGYVMIVNYIDSPVGPYKELLIIPGKFSGSEKHSITKIYVDSESSSQNGRANWGIPKNTLPFSWKSEKGIDRIKMYSGDQVVFACTVKSRGFKFPVSTKLLPIDLHQLWQGQDYYTKPDGRGRGKVARVEIEKCNRSFFPAIQKQNPLLAVRIDPFEINFPRSNHG